MGERSVLPRTVGRSLAWCANPYATWRTQPAKARLIVWLTYFAAGFLGVLSLLASGFAS